MKEITISPIVLNANRISLEPVSLDYLIDFHEYSTCKEFYEHFEYPEFKDIAETKKYLKK